ncbi:DUF2516 family protein [Puerhibacterium sp. TATVAM-FAB25]|uniref:DUF2516 family protein n=1 Tax=Puerhibacterium sp. TATVAM-FAB25 TaxID=3093699 RepID=UPI00397983FE
MLDLFRGFVVLIISLAVLVVAVIALLDAVRRPERAFASEGKLTKKKWLLILGAGALFALLGALGLIGIVLNIVAIAPAVIYWVDVRPAIKPYGTGRPRNQGPQW